MSVVFFKIPGSRWLKGNSERLIKENLNYINKNKKIYIGKWQNYWNISLLTEKVIRRFTQVLSFSFFFFFLLHSLLLLFILSTKYLWLKTHFRQNHVNKSSPRRALLRHLKENTRAQSASPRRANSPVKRLFTIARSQRLKPLDRGYGCFVFFLPSSCRKMSLQRLCFKRQETCCSLRGQIRVKLTSPRSDAVLPCSTKKKNRTGFTSPHRWWETCWRRILGFCFFWRYLCFCMQEIDTAEVSVIRAAKMLVVQSDKRDKRSDFWSSKAAID